MSDPDSKVPIRKSFTDRVKRLVNGSSGLDLESRTFVAQLKRVDQMEREAIERELFSNYSRWVSGFNHLNCEFSKVWEYFGELELELEGWHRVSPNGGQWNFLALTREGYSFSAAIERNVRKGAAYPTRWLSVSFAFVAGAVHGISDERELGRQGKIDQHLMGIENCRGKDLNQQLAGSRHMLHKLGRYKLVFGLHSDELGQQHTSLDLNVLEAHSLKELCQRLFIALNLNKIEQLRGSLESPEKILLGQ